MKNILNFDYFTKFSCHSMIYTFISEPKIAQSHWDTLSQPNNHLTEKLQIHQSRNFLNSVPQIEGSHSPIKSCFRPVQAGWVGKMNNHVF